MERKIVNLKKFYVLLGSKKFTEFFAVLFLIAGICFLLPAMQKLAISFGETFIVHRNLNTTVWIDRFIVLGKIFILSGILTTLSCFYENRHFSLIFLATSFFIVTASFIFEPVTGDIKVFSAAARQADYLSGNFIQNVYNSWELKSVGSRMTAYLLYKIAILFSTFPSLGFERSLLTVYFLFCSALLALSICLFFPEKNNDIRLKCFFGLEIILFSVQIMCRVQVEMTCTILFLLAFSLYVNSIKTKKLEVLKLVIAGFLVALSFFYKAVLILMAFSFLSAMIIYNRHVEEKRIVKKCIYMIIGGCLSLSIGIISILLINPYEFQDMINASLFQTTLLSGGHLSISGLVYNFVRACIGIPAIFIASIIVLNKIILKSKEKNFQDIVLEIILWGVPLFIIVLSNKFFIYHFYILLFPAVLEISFYLEGKHASIYSVYPGKVRFFTLLATVIIIVLQLKIYSRILQLFCIVLVVGVLLAVFVLQLNKDKDFNKLIIMILPCCFVAFVYLNYISIFSQNAHYYVKNDALSYRENIKAEYLWKDAESVLYLDDGSAGYMVGKKSYMKYFFPLPLQRIHDDSENAKSEFYKEQEELALNFDGKYIFVYEAWFFGNNNNVKLKEKIESEYTYIGRYYRFSPTDNLFEKQDSVSSMDVYERK